MSLKIEENVILASHTVYKIGGPARFFASVKDPEELSEAILFAKEKNLPIFVLGAGSNILVSDKGYDGLVIHLSMGGVEIQGTTVKVSAALTMAQVVAKTAQAGLAGFEWAIGVPGTIGGSVRGNAGCFGSEMKDVVERVSVLQNTKPSIQITNKTQNTKHNFQTKEFTNAECEFGYRDSIFKKHPEWIIVCATLKLQPGDSKEIQEKIKKITLERTGKQDIGTKSCGCIFKNVPWNRKNIDPVRSRLSETTADSQANRTSNGVDKEFLISRFPDLAQFSDRDTIPASYLLDQAGLKGRRVGKVLISPKHANFFINDGGATAEEVVMLISIAKDTVKRKFGILIEEEIQYVGF